MSKRVSPAEALELTTREGFTYVDVRTEAEWKAGHPTGSQNVPFLLSGPSGMAPNPEFVEVMKKLHAPEAKLVLGCKAGGRSAKAVAALVAAGFTNLVDQRAGWDGVRDSFGKLTEAGWSPAGLPSETETPGLSYGELKSRA